MNFHFSNEQSALRGLAREILTGEVSRERLKAVEGAGDFFDRDLWSRLAEANLLGLAVPEAQGGMGMGFLEVCLLLHEVGRAVAPVPAMTSLVASRSPKSENSSKSVSTAISISCVTSGTAAPTGCRQAGNDGASRSIAPQNGTSGDNAPGWVAGCSPTLRTPNDEPAPVRE